MNQVCVLGLGYIGLPTAALAASSGSKVVGVDIDPGVVGSLSAGRVHFAEPDLDSTVAQVIRSGALAICSSPCPADVFLIAVPTPINEDKTADLTFVVNAAESVVKHIRKGSLVIVESTVPPGTTEEVVLPILERSGLLGGRDFHLSYCPERVLPGRIVAELVSNDRVIGGLNAESARQAVAFYRKFVQGDMWLTDLKTAETVKLVENAYRDVSIAFANEISLIAGELGIDAWDVIKLANRHPRVNILNPGPGVGGHCIAVDPWFLVEKVPDATTLIATARRLNDSMPDHVVSRVEAAVKPGSKLACLGATYKADVSDTRESPALRVICELRKRGYEVYVVDPHATNLNGMPLVPLDEALEVADCVILLVDHSEFKNLDVGKLTERFGDGRLIDTRGLWKNSRLEVSSLVPSAIGCVESQSQPAAKQ